MSELERLRREVRSAKRKLILAEVTQSEVLARFLGVLVQIHHVARTDPEKALRALLKIDDKTFETWIIRIIERITSNLDQTTETLRKKNQLAKVRPKGRTKFSDETQARVLKRLRSEPQKVVAFDEGMSDRQIRNWKKKKRKP